MSIATVDVQGVITSPSGVPCVYLHIIIIVWYTHAGTPCIGVFHIGVGSTLSVQL